MSNVYGFELLARQAGDMVASNVARWANKNPLNVGTTPIETLFFYALEAHVQYYTRGPRDVLFCRGDSFAAEMDDERSHSHIHVEQQVDLGGWRVDFIVHSYSYFTKPPRWLHLIVECDGHDFHERTKEQAALDRSRDRAAAIGGLPILRFTGSELWNDPLGCADQVLHWFIMEQSRQEKSA